MPFWKRTRKKSEAAEEKVKRSEEKAKKVAEEKAKKAAAEETKKAAEETKRAAEDKAKKAAEEKAKNIAEKAARLDDDIETQPLPKQQRQAKAESKPEPKPKKKGLDTGLGKTEDQQKGGIPRGTVKNLRVFTYHYGYIRSGGHESCGLESGWDIKRILGTVPVEKDGSINVKIPAGKAIYFQLLDDQYRCVQPLRSFTGAMPGEVRGCVGCHEQRDNVLPMTVRSIAQKKGPATITPPPWGSESIGYTRFVQPILDKYCGSCHQGDKNPKARKRLDMTYRESDHKFRGRVGHRKNDKSPFAEPYLTFVSGKTGWGRDKEKISLAGAFIVEGYGTRDTLSLTTLVPMSIFSYKSKLLENATSGKHHNVKIDPASRRRLTAWIDCNCPYLGIEEIRQMDDPNFKHIETLKLRPRVKTAPEINRFNIRQDGDSTAVANQSTKNRSAP